MSNISVTVKNYRCFEDSASLRFEFKDGFTSFVGENNSGKSSALRLFYEFRPIWNQLSNLNEIKEFIAEPRRLANKLLDLYDQEEIYTDFNDRPLEIEFKFNIENIAENDQVNTFKLISNRVNWRIELYCGHNNKLINSNQIRHFTITRNNFLINKQENHTIDCSPLISFLKDVTNSMYIGAFRNAITEGSADYYDLKIGSTFIQQWNDWKTGGSKFQNRQATNIQKDLEKLFGFKSLEINASIPLKTLQVIIDGQPYKLRELGAGISQFIVVLGNIAIKNPAYLFIDEPEQNLHPALQLTFLTTIGSYIKHSVYFSTHSIGLARSSSENIYSFHKSDNKTIVSKLEQQSSYSQLLGELSYSTYKELGYESILFVEGVTDIKVILQFLRKLKKDHKVILLSLDGNTLADASREFELSELQRLSNNINILIDSERTSKDSDPPTNRVEFNQKCLDLGYNICMLELRATENYFTDAAIKSVLGPKFNALENYQKLNDIQPSWSKSDNWKIASEMHLDDFINTDLGKFLSSI